MAREKFYEQNNGPRVEKYAHPWSTQWDEGQNLEITYEFHIKEANRLHKTRF